jgi:hypothetical protein
MTNRALSVYAKPLGLALHGWLGLGLIGIFWPLNWLLPGSRTHWGFFPLWLGYSLAVDAWSLRRQGTSLLTRGWKRYLGLFLVSIPVWWLFEAINERTQNWQYAGRHLFGNTEYVVLASLSFSTVIPAVFGTAELMASLGFVRRLGRGPIVRLDRRTTLIFFAAGWLMLAALLIWPMVFFPFVWLSLFFILEPMNVWLGNRSTAGYVRLGNWRPVVALWLGGLTCGFFWEMWNYLSYPKWVYTIPWLNFLHIFEMPALGYLGYLPFALELFAFYQLLTGAVNPKAIDYVSVTAALPSTNGARTPRGCYAIHE